MRDEWDEKYNKPVVERKITGFSGLDPTPKKMSPEQEEEVERVIEEKVEEVVKEQIEEAVERAVEEKVEEQVEEIVNAVGEIRVGE